MDQISKDLSNLNVAMASALPASSGNSTASNAPRLATPAKNAGKNTQLVVPTDKAVAQAMEDALPVVKKVVGIHQCTMDKQSLRMLNAYGIPGSNFQDYYPQGFYGWSGYVGGDWRYHEKSTCPSVQLIDQWRMQALNALSFRVAYFADDSGESDIFTYRLRKSSAGTWQLEGFHRGGV